MNALTFYRPGFHGNSIFGNALSGFDRYLDSFFSDNFISPSERLFNRLPSVDIRETEKAYVLEAELPGLEEKDIQIRLDGGKLTIESKKASEKNAEASVNADAITGADTDGDGNYLIRERHISSFIRTFKLPENADPEGISASFRNGILSLIISKRAEAQTRVIQISKN